MLKLPVESDRAARPTVVFVDDGVTVSTKLKLIVLNDAGKSGEHFNDLYVSFYGAKSTPSRDIVIDVVAENGIAQPAEIARAIHVAIDEEADIVNISLSIEKSTDDSRRLLLPPLGRVSWWLQLRRAGLKRWILIQPHSIALSAFIRVLSKRRILVWQSCRG